ncbi:MAG: UbiH/UbiF/VisC/COQ6 family ubiquinone biosynthesis hydroxylase [Pseudomonadota bacterium]
MTSQPSPFEHDTDVVVVGAGMVGATCATALLQAGFSCVLVERTPPVPMDLTVPPGIRVSALNRASERVLRHIGAWDHIATHRAAPFRRMAVWEDDDGAETVFDAAEVAEPHLGHIVENNLIQEAALAAYDRAGGVLLCPAAVARFDRDGSYTHVTLDDGTRVRTRVLVAADGARSTLRGLAGIDAPGATYDQHALVATVATTLGQQDITWQRFQPSGPEAMLPLTGNRASLVWYHSPARVAELRALDEADFIDVLLDTFPARLGGVEAVIERSSFPLTRAHAERYVQAGFALIGDAAHSVHPLAGQGVNLGFMDAAALVDVLVDARAQHRDIGAERVLRRYQRWRRGENTLMSEVLHGFQRGFESRAPGVVLARRLLLSSGARVHPARHLACRYAMGLAGDLPTRARADDRTPASA